MVGLQERKLQWERDLTHVKARVQRFRRNWWKGTYNFHKTMLPLIPSYNFAC